MPRRSSKKSARKSSGARGSSTGGRKRTKSSGRNSSGPAKADGRKTNARGGKPKKSSRPTKTKSKSPQLSAKPSGNRATKSGGNKSDSAKPASSREKPQRLQRLLAAAGFGSRRQCESMIEEGRVEVDGQIISELGTVVDPKRAKVRVDGVPLRQQKLVYFAVNKPTGVLSTNADPRGRQRVIDLVPNSERVFPVGRLDQSSQGLMLLTNDGDLAQQLAHPKYGIRKVYRVTVAGQIDGETMRSMRKGIYISDGFVRVEGARILKSRARATELEITLREGKNREIRRILARLGHKVQVLKRVAIGPLRLGELPVGAYRALSREEVRRLRTAIEHSRDEVDRGSPGRPAASRGTSAKKRTAKKKRSGGRQNAETRADVTARRTRRKPAVTKFSFQPKKTDGGSVIGGD